MDPATARYIVVTEAPMYGRNKEERPRAVKSATILDVVDHKEFRMLLRTGKSQLRVMDTLESLVEQLDPS